MGKDWKARALLRAQLLEEGFEVEAHETAGAALEGLERQPYLPALLIADLSASDNPDAEVNQLASRAGRIPIWIIASRTLDVEGGLEGRGFERIFFRPVDAGELVKQIKQRLKGLKHGVIDALNHLRIGRMNLLRNRRGGGVDFIGLPLHTRHRRPRRRYVRPARLFL